MSFWAVGSYNSGANAMQIAASGLNDAQTRMSVVANNVANADSKGFRPGRVVSLASGGGGVNTFVDPAVTVVPEEDSESFMASQTDIATEFVNLIAAKNAYGANAVAARVSSETGKSIMEAFG